MNKQEMIFAMMFSEQQEGIIATLYRYYESRFKTRIAFSQAACDLHIDDLQLSVRSNNALKRQGIFTMGQVIDAIANDELVRIRNLGRKSINEIKTTVLEMGFRHLSDQERYRFFENMIDLNT